MKRFPKGIMLLAVTAIALICLFGCASTDGSAKAPQVYEAYETSYEDAGYRFVYETDTDGHFTVKFIDIYSEDDINGGAESVMALSPQIVSYEVTAPGTVVFNLSEPLTEALFTEITTGINNMIHGFLYK